MKNRHQLRDEYAKYGIDFTYNDRNRKVYLKIKGAPLFVEGAGESAHGQLTGWYCPPGAIRDVQDVPFWAQRTRDLYRQQYADNPHMLKYLDEAIRSSVGGAFVFEDELCIQDEHCSCIDGYLCVTEPLLLRLQAQLNAKLSPAELKTMENINFYGQLNGMDNSISLISCFWYNKDNLEDTYVSHASVQMPLTQSEAQALYDAMEAYCKQQYGMTCQDFLNDIRAAENLPPLTFTGPNAPPEKVPIKPSLVNRIQTAEERISAPDTARGHCAGAPER